MKAIALRAVTETKQNRQYKIKKNYEIWLFSDRVITPLALQQEPSVMQRWVRRVYERRQVLSSLSLSLD